MFIPKKNGKLRLVVDYRQLNEIIIKDRTPLPLISELKDAITNEPVLIMYNPNRPVKLKTDALNYALKAQIGYRNNKSKLYLIAFYSHKLNYFIYDKNFLTIINFFKKFRHYLKSNIYQI